MATKKPLAGRKIVLTAGPTREYLDTVRFISNDSSGLMGYSLARQAVKLGGRVVLVSGPVSLKAPGGVKVVKVTTACDMLKAVKKYLTKAYMFISTAAVCDFAPKNKKSKKIKKRSFGCSLKLKPAIDVLKTVCSAPLFGNIIKAGFSLEDKLEPSEPVRKLKSKKLDFIFANTASNLNSKRGSFLFIDKAGNIKQVKSKPKNSIAKEMFRFMLKSLLITFFCVRGICAAAFFVQDEIVEFAVSDEGYFSIGTSGGDPLRPGDGSKKLLFGHPNPGDSKTMYKIGSSVYLFGIDGTQTLPPQKNENTVVCAWKNADVEITQRLSVEKLFRGKGDSVKIYYKFENLSSETKNIALRIMLDTTNGLDDNAKFFSPGISPISTDTEWLADSPVQLFAMDDLKDPVVAAAYTLKGVGYTPPDRVVAGYAPAAKLNWDYAVDPSRSFLDNNNDGNIEGSKPDSDSALIAWWGYGSGIELPPGGSFEAAVFAGVASWSYHYAGGLDIALILPESINFSYENGAFAYLPNPFGVHLIARNILAENIRSGAAVINLPPEFELKHSQSKTKYMEKTANSRILEPSGSIHIGWDVHNYGIYTGRRVFSLSVSAGPDVLELIKNINISGIKNAVYGVVTDRSRNPIYQADAGVYHNGLLRGSASTNQNGEFCVSGLPAGRYSVVIEAVGYESLKLPYNVTEDGSALNSVNAVLKTASAHYAGMEAFVYPNPVREGYARISVRSNNKSSADILIFNSAGQKILSDSVELNPGGYAEYLWDISGTANGVYFYLVKSGGSSSKGKIAVLKITR